MMNNARAESAATTGRGGDIARGSSKNRVGPGGDSDYDGSPVDEIERRRPSHWARKPSRESI